MQITVILTQQKQLCTMANAYILFFKYDSHKHKHTPTSSGFARKIENNEEVIKATPLLKITLIIAVINFNFCTFSEHFLVLSLSLFLIMKDRNFIHKIIVIHAPFLSRCCVMHIIRNVYKRS